MNDPHDPPRRFYAGYPTKGTAAAALVLSLQCAPTEPQKWSTPSLAPLGVDDADLLRLPLAGRPSPGTTPERDLHVVALEARIQKLEQLVAHLLAERDGAERDEEEVPKGAHDLWIDGNRDMLLQTYPDSFVGLDAEKGIVVHARSGDDFEAQLDKMTPAERERLLLFHTSMYTG